jgi:SAM-dependent methyltransferase
MKLHICCGDVYLKNYINVDIQGRIRQPNDVVNETTFDKYYTKPFNFTPKDVRGSFTIDQKVDILKSWPWNDVSEIIMIQAIEHFNLFEGEFIISEIYRVLKSGGKFIFDFPDLLETFNSYKDDFDKLVRFIYCHNKDKYALHKTAYSESTFRRLLISNNRKWSSIEFKNVILHDYPVIGGIAIK